MAILQQARKRLRALLDASRRQRAGGPSPVRSFADRLASWLAVFRPDVRLLAMAAPDHTVLRIDRQEVLVDLGGLYAGFRREPEELGPVLERFLDEIGRELRSRTLPALEEAFDRLFPQVRAFSFLKENSPRFGQGRLARLGLAEDLFVLLVVDEGRGMTFVNEGHLQVWQATAAGLFQLALKNLEALGARLDAGGRLRDRSGYAAAHVAILDRLLGLEPGEEVLAAVPHRDLLLARRGPVDPRDREAMALEAAREWRTSVRPVSPVLLQGMARAGGGLDFSPVLGSRPAPLPVPGA